MLNYKLHCFYYNWYANPENDGNYRHWDHNIMPHWDDHQWDNLPNYAGGDDIGANFYPELGCYSSSNEQTIRQHFKWFVVANIGVMVITWFGEDSCEDSTVLKYLDIAKEFGIKVAFHIEPSYHTIQEFSQRIVTINTMFAKHDSVLKIDNKLVYYIYDSYRLPAQTWATLFAPDSPQTLRDSELDGVFIGIWVNETGEEEFFNNGYFDGVYTYFASREFVFGATPSNWSKIANWTREKNKIFIPCVGPGYIDTRIRPWNSVNSHERKSGLYYEQMFNEAVAVEPEFIGITSFNEWHEGTQIEPAIAKKIDGYEYESYTPQAPNFYLHKTHELSLLFADSTLETN